MFFVTEKSHKYEKNKNNTRGIVMKEKTSEETKKSRLALFLLDFAFQVIDHVGICFDAFHP